MHVTEIQDRHFGRLCWDATWGWRTEEAEWTPGFLIGLCIRTELSESDTIPECVRAIYARLRDQENAFRTLAARSLVDAFNAIWSEDDADNSRPDGWPLDAQSFASSLRLLSVFIGLDRESELQYATDGGPLLRVFVLPDLSFKEAFLD